MNQSPAWAWEGRRTGRPAWRVGETSTMGLARTGQGGDASRRKWSSCPAVPLPPELSPIPFPPQAGGLPEGETQLGPGWWVRWASGNPGSELEPVIMTELAEVCLALTLCLRPYYNPVREIVNAILQMRTARQVEVK